jgi:hypothetical protein
VRKPGRVISTATGKLKIRLEAEPLPPASCGAARGIDRRESASCASCSGSCGLEADAGRDIEVRVVDASSYSPGDAVTLIVSPAGQALNAILRIGLPLVLAIAAFLVFPSFRGPRTLLVVLPVLVLSFLGIGFALGRSGREPGVRVLRGR